MSSRHRLSVKNIRDVHDTAQLLLETTSIREQQSAIQHGSTSIFEHSLSVAFWSLKIARFFNASVREHDMIRGALLHDYFLYDWHNIHSGTILHGFYHPTIALNNAMQDCTLTDVERDIIKNHMFPLTIKPPKTKEGLFVSLADKICSTYETFRMNEWHDGKKARKPWGEWACKR